MTWPSWSFVDRWTAPRTAESWEACEEWAALLEKLSRAQRVDLEAVRRAWDEDLRELGGDPMATDWSTFAPLRREREEDWSAWLAQLLADSETGILGSALFSGRDARPAAAFGKPSVSREYATEDRRADLVIEWRDVRSYVHVEVKVGDPHLAKTPDTARKVKKAMAHCTAGADYLLVLPEQELAWRQLADASPKECRDIHLLTWRDVAVALRRALIAPDSEHVRWCVWAHAFCGAIEQELLGLPFGIDAEAWSKLLRGAALLAALDIQRASRAPRGEDD